jgi:hypothetical protein
MEKHYGKKTGVCEIRFSALLIRNIVYKGASKSKTLLFADSDRKKGQAKLALFWSKGKKIPRPDGFCVASTWFETQGKPAQGRRPQDSQRLVWRSQTRQSPRKKQGLLFDAS